MGSMEGAGHAFRTGISQKSFGMAFNAAANMDLSLEQALALTLLAAEAAPERYEAMAARWIAKMVDERRPTLHEIRWAVERLQDAGEGRVPEARKALAKFIR
jgi:hypothetical protein